MCGEAVGYFRLIIVWLLGSCGCEISINAQVLHRWAHRAITKYSPERHKGFSLLRPICDADRPDGRSREYPCGYSVASTAAVFKDYLINGVL